MAHLIEVNVLTVTLYLFEGVSSMVASLLGSPCVIVGQLNA
jgi:hypothetical protein